ncbi:hypothetical protein TeGR_g1033, partial [Tetraparma gracilis]
MPFPLTNREFLGRYLSFKEPTGDLVLVFEALPDNTKVDYGANLKVVRAKSTGVARFKPINDDTQCEVTLVQHVNAGGFVPERVVVAKIPQALRGVADMRVLFQRDEAIDGAKRSELAAIMKAKNEIYTDAENAVVNRVRDQLGGIPDSSFEKFESPDHFVHMEGFHKGGKNGIPRASTVLDEDICTCAALSFSQEERDYVKAFFANGGMERAVTVHNRHYVAGQLLMDFNIPTFSPREFVARSVWRWESEKVLLVATESCLAEQYPIRYVSNMRKRFDKSPAIDAASSLRLKTRIQIHDEPYTEKEEEILRVGVSHFSLFEAQKGKEVKLVSPSTKAKMAYEKGNNFALGYVWFRPMMDTIAQRLLESVSWGLKMRLYTGAGLSTMDLFTDLYMIYTYATTGQQGTAKSLGIMVGVCLLGQQFVVWFQTRKGPRRVMLKEMLIVLSGMKPGVDAKRVAGGNEKGEHAAVDPDLELTYTRCMELFCESIPGTLLQLAALLKGMRENDGKYSKAALASIVVSACTTGFTAATISFDFDVSPARRRDEPGFYGYIPDSAGRRTTIFFCMIMNAALLLLLRSLSTALLAMVGGRLVLYYYLGDHV